MSDWEVSFPPSILFFLLMIYYKKGKHLKTSNKQTNQQFNKSLL